MHTYAHFQCILLPLWRVFLKLMNHLEEKIAGNKFWSRLDGVTFSCTGTSVTFHKYISKWNTAIFFSFHCFHRNGNEITHDLQLRETIVTLTFSSICSKTQNNFLNQLPPPGMFILAWNLPHGMALGNYLLTSLPLITHNVQMKERDVFQKDTLLFYGDKVSFVWNLKFSGQIKN